MDNQKIAFLGLGAMGTRMAGRLLDAGFRLTVWNRSGGAMAALINRGARGAESPRAAAEGADIVLSMVRDDAASLDVWLDPALGALGGMRPGAVAVECSTLSLGHVRQLAFAVERAGVGFLDAPLAGSRPQAEAGQLIFMVGGQAADLAQVRPVLGAMGGAVHHAGAEGAGMAVKLAVNALLSVQVAALAELVGMLAANGMDAAAALEIVAATPVMSAAAKAAVASMLSGRFAPQFPVNLAEKDLGYLMGAAGSQMPVADAARAVLHSAMGAGFGAENLTGIVRLYVPEAHDREAVQ